MLTDCVEAQRKSASEEVAARRELERGGFVEAALDCSIHCGMVKGSSNPAAMSVGNDDAGDQSNEVPHGKQHDPVLEAPRRSLSSGTRGRSAATRGRDRQRIGGFD
jgi:hypothetical protein